MSQSAASDSASITVAAESLFFLGSTSSMTREGESAGRLADAAARASMSSEILRSAMLVLPSEFMLVLGLLLLVAMGTLTPVFPLMASPVVPPPSTAASAGVGLVTAAAAAARDDVVAAACDGAAGVFCGGWAARWGWRLGGMMTIAIESVTATVIDLHVCWKGRFVLRLEAWLSSSLDAVAVAALVNEKDADGCSSVDDLGLSLNH